MAFLPLSERVMLGPERCCEILSGVALGSTKVLYAAEFKQYVRSSCVCADKAHAFSAFANWVIPGHLMVGRYPYVDPNRFR